MEPALVRRILIGAVGACLVVGALAAGWARERAQVEQRVRKVDLPAKGGELVEATPPPLVTLEATELAARRSEQEPPARGGGRLRSQLHEVASGETLFKIGKRYGLSTDEIQRVNGLASDLIRPGQLLVIPGGDGAESELVLGGTYTWPVLAPISSAFGQRWGRQHKGIDLAANQGDQIRASRAGEVLIAGEVPGYGKTVILTHGDGSRTLYGHCSRLLVETGQTVKQGEAIALVGSTGHSTGPHLHFEIIIDDQPIDPILYLPKR